MSIHKEFWNNEYIKYESRQPKYELWLDKYADILKETADTPVIDLGCGLGSDSLYLLERGFKVISCDISEVALERVRKNVPGSQTMLVDMLDGLPFEDSSARVIVADLSLHYFHWADTVKIVKEIKRVLADGGHLLCRVNSTRDTNYGAGQGDIIEENYYADGSKVKRFFDREQIDRLFAQWELKYVNEYQMDRYKLPKILWEIAAMK